MHPSVETVERRSRARFDVDGAYAALAGSGLDGRVLLELAIGEGVSGRTAVVSSFGAEAVVLLGLVAAIDPSLPVLFLQTDRHFPETLAYRDVVVETLGLRNVWNVTPDPAEAALSDPTGDLWWFDPDTCCDLRKVRPLGRALDGFDSWITGRKRRQAQTRADMPPVELEGGLIKLNPLATWDAARISHAIEDWKLPQHPLVSLGYRSIGCAPCTRAVGAGEGERAGRWSGSCKTECGIHRLG